MLSTESRSNDTNLKPTEDFPRMSLKLGGDSKQETVGEVLVLGLRLIDGLSDGFVVDLALLEEMGEDCNLLEEAFDDS